MHESLGVIDVSTLGKLFVEGPEAVALLERLYPNRFGDMKPGRIRYGVLTSDGGRIMDDGTIARLADDLFYVTTTSTGADAVTAWFEWWNAVWGYDAEIVNVTGALAAVNLAGPQSREALQRLTEADVSAEAFKYLDVHEIDVAGVPTLALRIGFVGELGYELHFPSPAGEHLWDALVGEGARPFGLEPQRVLRLEKGHVIVGQDTDSESNLYSSGMSWLPKMDKDDFVGKFALEHFAQRDEKEKLVGFTMEDDVLPAEGAQIVVEGLPAGRVTSARRSEAVDQVIGLAWVTSERSQPGTRVEIQVDRLRRGARITQGAFFDPTGRADALVSRSFLSPSRCAEETVTSPLRRALEDADPAAVRDLSLEGVVEIRGNVDSVTAGEGEELVRLSSRRAFLFTDGDAADVAERVRAGGVLAYDATGALAGIAIASEQAMRRLTDLDLGRIPTAGPFAHVTALFRRGADGWFHVYVQQELGHYVAEAVLDALAGLERA